MKKNKVHIIDQTMREGMLFHGMIFSLEERKTMLDFQETLGIEISQVAYPIAHPFELDIFNKLVEYAAKKKYQIQIAGHARALTDDVQGMIQAGGQSYHLHTGVNPVMLQRLGLDKVANHLEQTVTAIRKAHSKACIKTSLLDVAHSESDKLAQLIHFMSHELNIDIITLPDTSGAMLPEDYAALISQACQIIKGSDSQVAVHCHNDLGLACANSLAGIEFGATVVEVSVLGIGERNGIADLATMGQILKKAGHEISIGKMENQEILQSYYQYVNGLIEKKTGLTCIHYETPIWGQAVSTMGAGSHGIAEYGIKPSTQFFINHMCGRSMVKRYLDSKNIHYDESALPQLVQRIKTVSVEKQCSLTAEEIEALIQ